MTTTPAERQRPLAGDPRRRCAAARKASRRRTDSTQRQAIERCGSRQGRSPALARPSFVHRCDALPARISADALLQPSRTVSRERTRGPTRANPHVGRKIFFRRTRVRPRSGTARRTADRNTVRRRTGHDRPRHPTSNALRSLRKHWNPPSRKRATKARDPWRNSRRGAWPTGCADGRPWRPSCRPDPRGRYVHSRPSKEERKRGCTAPSSSIFACQANTYAARIASN